jgi:3-hydroxy-9,10-secoandrosta-1,3,5(10)-triene-9,17-dione monooxygenase reductase component
VPTVEDVPLWIVCELEDLHDAGDHVILIGAVVDVGDEGGEPLVFHGGSYRGLGSRPGSATGTE